MGYCTYEKKINTEDLLKNSLSLTEDQKQFFKALAEELNKSQNEFFEHIQKRTIYELSDKKVINTIYTLLANPDEIVEGFNPILEKDEEDNNIIFIDCPYSEIAEFEKKVKGKKYKLERTDVYVKKEIILSTLFRMYNIEQPYIYSPYSRRAFKVYELNDRTGEYNSVDFKRNNIELDIKNSFYGKLQWNISVTPDKSLRPKLQPINGVEYMRYENCDDNSFIIPACERPEMDVIKSVPYKPSGCNYIDVLKNDYDSDNFDFIKVVINKNTVDRNRQYQNNYNINELTPKRLLTQADIYTAVQKFYPYPEEFQGIHGKLTNGNTVKDYSNGYRYTYQQLSAITYGNRNFCYLKFENKGNDNFFEDRINFFISFMRYNYPNFYWVGVM